MKKKVTDKEAKMKRKVTNKVKQFRDEKPWTKARLAREADVTAQTVTKMEEGRPTRRDSQLKVAKALGRPPEEVFPETN